MKIKPIGLFATPESMKDLQDYLALFNGSEVAVAQTCAWMAWNLACKLTNPCDMCHGLGWVEDYELVDEVTKDITKEYGLEVQRCDECNKFGTDEEAQAAMRNENGHTEGMNR